MKKIKNIINYFSIIKLFGYIKLTFINKSRIKDQALFLHQT